VVLKRGLDPRTKLALGLMAILAVFFAREPVTLTVECVIIMLAVALLGLGRKFIRSLHMIWPMLLLVFVMGIIFFDLKTAVLLCIRLVSLLTVSFIFFQSVAAEEMGAALGKMKVPFAFTFILTTSLRYVPLIGQKIRRITDAQQARGIDLRPRIRNIKNFMALLMPLLVQSFLLSDDLALAMESRGFGRKNRTSRRSYHLSLWEYGLMAASLALLIALIWWERW
jgi:energy-coupling factor transport system permease protein